MDHRALADSFSTLVAFSSPTGSEDEFANYLVERLRNLVDFVGKDGFGNVYAYVHGKGEPVFFAAHMDTVQPGVGIKAAVRDGYLVSDGSTILGADNKAAICAYICVLEELKRANVPHRPLEFVFTKSEEIGNYGAIHFDYSLLRSQQGFCFDSVAPIGTVITASPFYERLDINVKGKSAHASKPEEAVNVLQILPKVIESIPVGRINETTICNLGKIDAGHARNTVPGNATLQCEIRSFVEQDLVQHLECIRQGIATLNLPIGVEVELVHERENPGYYHRGAKAKKLISLVTNCMNGVGLTPMQVDSMAVSDANIFNTKGLLCLNLGDGVENAHTVEERIALADLEDMVSLCQCLASV